MKHFDVMKKVLAIGFLAMMVTAVHSNETIMNQIGNDTQVSGGFAAQQFEAAFTRFDVAIIDDFTTTSTGFVLKEIQASVLLFGGTTGVRSFNNITGWRVEIYTSPNAAAANLVGDAGRQVLAPSEVTVDNDGWAPANPDLALVTLPVSITLARNTQYWLGVIPIMNFGGGFGQSSMSNSTFAGTPGNFNSVQVNPGGGFGLPNNMAARNTNVAYRINAVPEPASMIALGTGLVGFALRRRKK